MKKAIIYYSLSGNTEKAAKTIAEAVGADIFRIDTVKPMPTSFGQQVMYGGMLTTFGMKPKITGIPDNITEYDEIIIGTPIWAGKHAAPFNTVFASKEIRERVTAVFTLSGGGDNDKCVPKLEKLLPNLKHVIALADKKLGKEAENEEKLTAFLQMLN